MKQRVVHYAAHAVFAALVFVFWTLPMILFCVAVWRKGRFALTAGFLLCAGASFFVLRLPARYYRPKSFESDGRVYELLGVRFYKRWMMNGDYMNRLTRRFVPGYRIVSGADSLRKFEAQARRHEKGHLLWFIITALAGSYAAVLGSTALAACLFLSSLLVHLYPLMLQRYTRARIYRRRKSVGTDFV